MTVEELIYNINNLNRINFINDTHLLYNIKLSSYLYPEAKELEYEILSKKYMQKYNLNINELNKNLDNYSKHYLKEY